MNDNMKEYICHMTDAEKKAYNAELTSRTRGLLEHWGDPELGDVAFHKEVIAPFCKKYGAYASLGLTLNGILTALLTPMVLRLLGII